jgi:hypothetical protein
VACTGLLACWNGEHVCSALAFNSLKRAWWQNEINRVREKSKGGAAYLHHQCYTSQPAFH